MCSPSPLRTKPIGILFFIYGTDKEPTSRSAYGIRSFQKGSPFSRRAAGFVSESPAGCAARLLGGNRVDTFGDELVDMPGRWAGAWGTELMCEAPTGDGWCPTAFSEHIGEAME